MHHYYFQTGPRSKDDVTCQKICPPSNSSLDVTNEAVNISIKGIGGVSVVVQIPTTSSHGQLVY